MFKEINKHFIHYEEIGENSSDVLIILQGWNTSSSLYKEIADFLSNYYKVILFDLPGFGLSQEPDTPWTVNQYANFVSDLIQTLQINNVNFLAHSFGGRIAIELVSKTHLPFEIGTLFFVDIAGVKNALTTNQKIKICKYKILKKITDTNIIYSMFPDLIDWWRENQGSADYREASNIMRQVLVKAVNYDQTHLLKTIKQPTHIIWGEKDDDTPVSIGKILHSQIQTSTFDVIPDSGHFPFIDNKQVFLNILEKYIIRK